MTGGPGWGLDVSSMEGARRKVQGGGLTGGPGWTGGLTGRPGWGLDGRSREGARRKVQGGD